MRIIFYLISSIIISCCIFSCAKGDLVKDPQFGSISFVSSSSENIKILLGNDHVITTDGTVVNAVSGKNRFRFYTGETLLKDTILLVEPFIKYAYTLFKPNEKNKLKIFDSSLNGFDKEVLPDSGLVKFSIANFSTSLPDKVDIYVSTTTYTPFSDKPIQVGEFLNVSSSFSKFQTIMVGISATSYAVNNFTLTIKNHADQTLLTTIPLVLPIGTTGITFGKLTRSVYLLYLNNFTSSILMSK